MPTYISPKGNPEVWEAKPAGYYNTMDEFYTTNPHLKPDPCPGPDYEKIGEAWVKVRFSRKDFMLHCSPELWMKLNAVKDAGNALAKFVHDLVTCADFVDVRDPATIEMVNLLTTEAAGKVLSTADAERILKGLPYASS